MQLSYLTLMMFKNLKKAVLISGHLRSFYSTWNTIKEFYGDSTDYYFTVWDHDLLGTTKTNFNIQKFKSFLLEDRKVKSLNFITVEELLDWTSGIKNCDIPYEEHYGRFGQIFNCYINLETSKEYINTYDIVFRNRLDAYPRVELYSNDQFSQHLNKLDVLYSTKDLLQQGLFRFGDCLFYSSPETYIELFKNLDLKISEILSNPFFKSKENILTNHKLWGTIVQFSNIERVRPSAFSRKIIRL